MLLFIEYEIGCNLVRHLSTNETTKEWYFLHLCYEANEGVTSPRHDLASAKVGAIPTKVKVNQTCDGYFLMFCS